MKKKIIIIDSNWVLNKTYHVSKYSNKDFDLSKQETYTPLMRKVFTDITSLLRSLKLNNHDEVWFSFDQDKSQFRLNLLPTYKGDRGERDLYFFDFIKEVRKILQYNFNTIVVPGVESDDIISVFSSWFRGSEQHIVYIVSGDEDLQQLISENTVVLSPLKGVNRYSIVNGFKIDQLVELNNTTYQVVDKKLLLFNKILLGCDSDCIPRILKRGIGPKTIEKLYNEHEYYLNSEDKNIYSFINLLCEDKKYLVDIEVINTQIQLVDLSLSEKTFTSFQFTEFEDSLSNVQTVKSLTLPTMESLLEGTKYLSSYV